jgi:hypothetical protein
MSGAERMVIPLRHHWLLSTRASARLRHPRICMLVGWCSFFWGRSTVGWSDIPFASRVTAELEHLGVSSSGRDSIPTIED